MMNMKNGLLKYLNNDRGSILLISYFVVIVMLILGAAFVILATGESRVAERQRMTSLAFHIAEAGIERALYDLKQDFINDPPNPTWNDGDINSMMIGPDTVNFYDVVDYTGTFSAINDGNFAVRFRNEGTDGMWIESTGTFGDAGQKILVYAKVFNVVPWKNAIFGGAGSAGAQVNGNVDIRGSVHILGDGLTSADFAIDLGGTSELIGNNYTGLDASLLAKVPALPQTIFNGETIDTLNAELRVRTGIVGLSGSATAGDLDVFGNGFKETIDGSYVSDGFGGTQGIAAVHSDNGWSNSYDLGDALEFPTLSSGTQMADLKLNALVLTTELNSITPSSSFTYSGPNGSISMTPAFGGTPAKMVITGIVFVDGDNDLNFSKSGSKKTIEYTGQGTIVVTGNAQINVNLVTEGSSSFPSNILGVMTPNNMEFNEANINVMGLFYAEDQITIKKQTDIMGTIMSNYFDMGTNVPSIYQVPETSENLPPGMIASDPVWIMTIVSWQKIE